MSIIFKEMNFVPWQMLDTGDVLMCDLALCCEMLAYMLQHTTLWVCDGIKWSEFVLELVPSEV